MNVAGLGLVLLTILFVCCQMVAQRYIKKVANCYFFWFIVGTLCFAWLMTNRFALQFSTFWSHGPFDDPGDYSQSLIISRGLMLDICPMMGFLMPIACMVDPTRKAASVMAPTSLLAGAITIGSLVGDGEAVFTASYIFYGTTANPCYFIMHFLQIVLAVGIMLNTPKYNWKGWIWALGFILLLYTYVGICKSITGARWFVSGLDYNDWGPQGEYYRVAKIFNVNPKICPYIGIPVMLLVGCGIVALKDKVFHRKLFKYGNAYSGTWFMWYDYNKFVKQRIF